MLCSELTFLISSFSHSLPPVLGIELRPSCIPGKLATTELQLSFYLVFQKFHQCRVRVPLPFPAPPPALELTAPKHPLQGLLLHVYNET